MPVPHAPNASALVRDVHTARKETFWNDYAWSKNRRQSSLPATETTPSEPQPDPASSESSEEKRSSQKRLKAKFVYVRKCADAAEADAHRAVGLAAARAKSKAERAAFGMTPSQYDEWKWETRFARLVDPDYYTRSSLKNGSPLEDA
jgi:hypothetical protein